jgi:hypothetical protein
VCEYVTWVRVYRHWIQKSKYKIVLKIVRKHAGKKSNKKQSWIAKMNKILSSICSVAYGVFVFTRLLLLPALLNLWLSEELNNERVNRRNSRKPSTLVWHKSNQLILAKYNVCLFTWNTNVWTGQVHLILNLIIILKLYTFIPRYLLTLR